MTGPIDRDEFRWGTAEGDVLTIDDITDEHLANIIRHVKMWRERYPNEFYLRCFLREEARRRGLGSNFLGGAPHPYRDKNGVKRTGKELDKSERIIVDYLIRHWDSMDKKHQDLVVKEIEESIERGAAGANIDVREWERILKLHREE